MSAEVVAERWMAEKTALDALLTYANDATQAGDTDFGEAIRTLVDGYGKGGGDVLVESFDIEIPTQVTEYDIFLSKPCDMVSVALKGTPSAQSTTAWMMAYDSTIDDCGIYGIPTPTASYRFINNTSWQCRWSGTSHVPQVQTITQSSLRQELLGDKRYYAHLYRNAASYPILAGTYEVKTYKRYAD